MTFDVLNDHFWVPDHVEWAEINKQNLATRKEEWKKIQPSLKVLAKLNRNPTGYLSVHKSLFFNGTLPDKEKSAIKANIQSTGIGHGGEKLFFSFPLFYFWYHPNLSDQIIESTFERYTQAPIAVCFKEEITATAIQQSKQNFSKLQSPFDHFDEYGIMGGREELIAPYLILGSKNGTVLKSFRDGWFNPSCSYLLNQMLPGMSVLEGRKAETENGLMYLGNPHGTGQYIWPQVSHYIQRHYSEFLTQPKRHKLDGTLQTIDVIIQKILFHGEYPKTQTEDPLAIACRDRILSQYRNGELADWLSELFAQRERLGMDLKRKRIPSRPSLPG